MSTDNSFTWPTDASHYEYLGRIGKGAFSQVYKARCKDNGAIVAIKIMKLEDVSISLEDIRKEVLTMKLCDHKNVLACHCCFNVGSTLWIVTPMMIKGSFLRILQYMKEVQMVKEEDGLSEPIVAYVIGETAKALKYLHDSDFIHRDVKAGNILVDAEGNVRLGDLGVSRLLESTVKDKHAKTFVGTPCWMAPEVMNRFPYDNRADVWSLGITAMELFKGIPPFAGFDPMEVLIMTVQGDAPSFERYKCPSDIKPSSNFCRFIGNVLKKEVAQRYTIDKVLSFNWITSNAEQGKEELLQLLQKIPDLEGTSNGETFETIVNEMEGFVKGTTWNFSLDNVSDAKPGEWLNTFNEVSVNENDADK